MSTFKQKKELKAQITAAKKAGKSAQTIGRLQYKLNQLSADPKGNAVKTKSGKVVKTGTGGTVRQKPKANLPKKKRIISKGLPRDPDKTGGHPSLRYKAATTYAVPRSNVNQVGNSTGSVGSKMVSDRALVANSNNTTSKRIPLSQIKAMSRTQLRNLERTGTPAQMNAAKRQLGTMPPTRYSSMSESELRNRVKKGSPAMSRKALEELKRRMSKFK